MKHILAFLLLAMFASTATAQRIEYVPCAIAPDGTGATQVVSGTKAYIDSIWAVAQSTQKIAGSELYYARRSDASGTTGSVIREASVLLPYKTAYVIKSSSITNSEITIDAVLGANITDTVPIAHGGTSAKTRQAAIDGLSNVSTATTGWLLTDSSSHAVWQVAPSSSKCVVQCTYPTRFNAGAYLPIAGGFNFVSNPPSVTNANVTVFSIAGTLKNWTLAVNAAGTTDTVYLYKSTNHGSTWTATTIKVILNGVAFASDNTHTSAVSAGDWYSFYYGVGGEDLGISSAVSCMEFDPN